MARKPRTWFPGAKYHVYSRGNRQMPLFLDDVDFRKYLAILMDTQDKEPFYLHSYCLMTNHVHLQIETIDISLSKTMKTVNSRYATYFNKKHGSMGHVFQGRYGAELLNDVKYEIDVSRYIHRNPIEAQIVHKPEDYPWSSFWAYRKSFPNYFVRTDHILSFFPDPSTENYQQFVEGSDPYENVDNSQQVLPYLSHKVAMHPGNR
ncbi:transposase [Pseudalkalibacillus caeni]|uniref:transposase n=1 Tax=Exobacillus caeni TaxID=2574798 RepID=UPI001FE43FB3|nr:transposase [Pseudalkalibacillus caeni]